MNFYARQEAARQRTRRLVLLFVLAVVAVTAAVNLVVLTLLASGEAEGFTLPTAEWLGRHPGSIFVTTVLVLAVIGVSSLYKSTVLRGGGGVVARALGGTRIDRAQQDPLRRRLFNVVEEMSIASGVPMPEIYVLEQETGINAFAAGHSPANAAVAVTRGALERLNRAELQGVIAHEFSHVLNGDMRLNIRLMGLLFGLLVIALIARTVLRHAPRGSGNRKRGAVVIMLAALAVMTLGYVGVFFGRMIQAAVSRQRETLADASAVQFTREPQGLRGALVKIGGSASGSKLADPQTDEVAHMLFASGMRRLFATHPPIIERIRALDPSFDPSEFARVAAEAQRSKGAVAEPAASESPRAPEPTAMAGALLAAPAGIAQRIGNPGIPEIAAARTMARSLPPALVATLDEPGRALSTLLALVLDPDPALRSRQCALIVEHLGMDVMEQVGSVEREVVALSPAQRLPVLGEVFPALRRLPKDDRLRLLDALRHLILVDGQIRIFEYSLATLARIYLREGIEPAAPARQLRLDKVAPELQTVFSTLARHGAADDSAARRAYELGMHHLLPHHRPDYRPVPGWPGALDRALACLDRLVPAAKEQLIEALVKSIGHDGRLTVAEAELFRAICASLHCPMPPLPATSS